MATQIKCTNCGTEIEITQAIRAELETKILAETQAKHSAQLQKLEQEKRQLVDTQQKELENAKKHIAETARKAAIEQVRQEYDAKIQSTKEEAQERDKQNQQLQQQTKELFQQLRQLKDEKGKLEIEYEKKLLLEQDKIKQDAKKEAQDELGLRIAEKEKKLQDAQKQILELQRKIQQGSQQLQGEVMELELETLLKREFPLDGISEVKKGQRGADVVHEVMDKQGRSCGVILWESKNAKWSQTWIPTLKENQRQAKAAIAVLLVNEPPSGLETFRLEDGVWLSTRKMALPLAMALRYDLIRVNFEKLANINKSEKAEILYQYITSTDFKHRIEAIVETFGDMQQVIETEKRWFNAKWAKQEKQIRRIIDNTLGMRADVEGLVGNALPTIEYLELSDSAVSDQT